MTKIKYLVLLSFALVLFQSCTKDASAPPQPSFTVDKTTGQADSTVFTFTINQVNADAISLYPYGTGVDPVTGAVHGGILIPSSSFVNGTATVQVQYSNTGTFNAVAVANNHTANGSSIKIVTSEPVTITVFSNWAEITYFSLNNSVAVTNANAPVPTTINITVPYASGPNKPTDITKLKANFALSPLASVKVGSVTQVSGTTVNDFSSSVQYIVTSGDGKKSTTYTVNATVAAAETDSKLKSASGVEAKSSKNKAIPAYVGSNFVVFYDTLVNRTAANVFDSVQVNYVTNGTFGSAKYNSKALKQGTWFKLTSAPQITVYAQDSTTTDYTLYGAVAPTLSLSFTDLYPVVNATTSNFTITANVLSGTDVSNIVTTATVDQASGTSATILSVNGSAFTSGVTAVDYSNGATFVIQVVDSILGVTYNVTYTASVNVK